jgi:predicted  nucleic acid-binding Zn-ribbon protein
MQPAPENDYVTKQDLKETFKEFRIELLKELLPALDARIDIKLEAMERRIDDRARKYNSEILTRFDSWAGALETANIERTVTSKQISKLSDKVSDHEKRLKKA